MKRRQKTASLLLAGLGAALLLSGCAGTRIKRLSGTEFAGQAKQIEEINSFHWTSYIGCSAQRAYLEFAYPALLGGGARTTVFWTPLSELPDDMRQKLKTVTSPWRSLHPMTESKQSN